MKTIPNFENYAATKDGRIWSKKSEKWLKPQRWGNYLRVSLFRKKKVYQVSVHRIILETFVGKCPKNMGCRHINNNPRDNRISNLRWGTQKENIQDQVKHRTHSGFFRKGENSPMSKLKEADVRMIIYTYRTGLFTQKEVAGMYNTDQANVCRIINRKNWKHIWI